jgi:pyruvate kinase
MKIKRTKIVATVGPATENKKNLERIIEEGVNVVRLNFSHGDHEWHEKIIKMVRELSEKMDIPVGILADLQGPRIRTLVDKELKVNSGEKIILSDVSKKINPQSKNFKSLKLDCPGIIRSLKVGNNILIADGLMRLRVVKKGKDIVETEVIDGGVIKNHKGVNIPDAKIPLDAMTEKDEEDLHFALRNNVDFIGLSFVSSGNDIKKLRRKIEKFLKVKHNLPQIVAKIERKDAIKNLDQIIEQTDAVMVARGDLGIEMDETRVAVLQKEIVEKSLRAGKPVIVATQMLGSMIKRPRPTRAEVSDVSNAVVDHADAVMLSEESAMGKYPQMAVKTMREIIEITEESPFDDLVHGYLGDNQSSISLAVANSAHELSKDSGAKAIVVASLSGFTARMISRHRPEQRIYVMTNSEKTHNQLALVWGAESFILPDCKNLDDLIIKSVEILKRKRLLKKGDRVVVVTGRPHVKKEHMSLVKVEEIK